MLSDAYMRKLVKTAGASSLTWRIGTSCAELFPLSRGRKRLLSSNLVEIISVVVGVTNTTSASSYNAYARNLRTLTHLLCYATGQRNWISNREETSSTECASFTGAMSNTQKNVLRAEHSLVLTLPWRKCAWLLLRVRMVRQFRWATRHGAFDEALLQVEEHVFVFRSDEAHGLSLLASAT